jgi:hypothetical protein
MQLFRISHLPERLEELRAPAGSFRQEAASELLEQGLVRYVTETGIAFQGPEDWDIVLTDQGMCALRAPSSKLPRPT